MNSQPRFNTIHPQVSPAARYLCLVVLMAATLIVYSPVKQHPFINVDDQPYVVHNHNIQQLNWETVKWSFTAFRAANWHPLTWLSHAVDYHFFSLNAGRHHEVNLVLHVVNAMLLFWLLSQATGYLGRSFVVAALFALHPVNVETVAWIAERKNLLSMFFFLLALGAYRWYASKPQVGRYLCVALLFALGLMSKPQVITLPFVLLLWDYWPLERIAFRSSPFAIRQNAGAATSDETRRAKSELRFLLLEKLPLFALAVVSAVVTMKAQAAGGTMSGAINTFSFSARLGNAVLSYVRYLGNAIWPSRLAFFYPHVKGSQATWQIMGSAALLLVTWWALSQRGRRYLAVGWLWFVGTMIPMIGIIQVGSQAMADRYAYLPFIGLFIAICWGVADLVEGWPLSKVWVPAGVVAVLVCLSLATRRQLTYWSDDLTLWEHSAEVVNNNWMAENMIGEDFLREGDRESAIPHFRAAETMEPLFPFPHLHIGIYDEEHQHPREALQELQHVIDLTEPYARYTPVIRSNALVYMSYSYNQLGDYANQQRYVDLAAQQKLPE
jgi:tetratricopeptide (TPR) repeat protein